MHNNLLFLSSSVIILSLLLAACGGAANGPSAADLAATQQSLESTQQALNAQAAQPSNTPEPPVAEAATQEPAQDAATEAPVSQDEAYYTEEFSSPPQNWTYDLYQGDEQDFDLYTEGDKLVFDIQGANVWSYYLYDSYTYTDARVDFRAENLGNNNNNVSLICRYNSRGWYEFNVANNGLYWIYRYDYDTNEFTLLYNGGVANLKTGKDTNDYTMICEGDRLTLGVNGTEIRTVEDSRFDEGQLGISVSSFDDTPVLVEVDYVTISVP